MSREIKSNWIFILPVALGVFVAGMEFEKWSIARPLDFADAPLQFEDVVLMRVSPEGWQQLAELHPDWVRSTGKKPAPRKKFNPVTLNPKEVAAYDWSASPGEKPTPEQRPIK